MTLERASACKVNLCLNILGRRPDGYHELETLFHPVRLCDELRFTPIPRGVVLTCSDPTLPTDARNLVHRAATRFLEAARLSAGVDIHLHKRIPLAAGLGGGSSNAATTLRALNELFGHPLTPQQLHQLATGLGADVPFFLQDRPALATGRGEQLQPLEPFPVLRGCAFFLIHPGFGISTAWAYQQLARFPAALHGTPGRAARLAERLRQGDWAAAAPDFYNALEAPALEKFPLLALFQEFLRAQGAPVALMSGSGSTTFALAPDPATARAWEAACQRRFWPECWTVVVPIE